MKKITVNKSDEVSVIVEKMIEAEDDDITLSVPRFSHLGESLSNFYLLKREADAIGKKISVESIDDKVIELAGMSGLTGTNPFFAKNKRQFSDIVAPRSGTRSGSVKSGPARLIRKEIAPKLILKEKRAVELPPMRRIGEVSAPAPAKVNPLSFSLPGVALPKMEMPEMRFSRKWLWWIAGFAIVAGGLYLAATVLPRADVKIVAQKKDWTFTDAVTASKATVSDIKAMTIPAQVFSEPGNTTNSFPATGRKQVQQAATGQITVFNSFSSDPQQLVAKTRFADPDGKIFRLVNTVMVPGAKIVDGKINPSSIAVNVVADVAGPDSNIGPTKLFTIPGFKGTPKYQTFYGESSVPMQGGFIGEVAYPTVDDISKAEVLAAADIEGVLNAKLFAQIPFGFKILDGSRSYKVLNQKADATAGKDGNFNVLTSAQTMLLAFRDTDVMELLKKRALADNAGDFHVASSTLSYGAVRADFDKGILSFPVHFTATLARNINADDLKTKIAGKSEAELKSMIFALPGLDSATISLWPFWVKTVPKNLDKITVSVE